MSALAGIVAVVGDACVLCLNDPICDTGMVCSVSMGTVSTSISGPPS